MKYLFACWCALLLSLSIQSTSSCTLKQAQENFNNLNIIFQEFNRQMSDYSKRSETPPPNMREQRREILQNTVAMRKLFTEDVKNNANMKNSDPVNSEICNIYSEVMGKHERVLAVLKAEQKPEKIPECTRKNIRQRFGVAIRTQRKLAIAGKITPKERVAYLKIAKKFSENTKRDFDEACQHLYEYEKMLKAEKDEDQGE